MAELGRELRRRREAAGYSLSRMATAVYTSKSHLSKVENGRTRVTRQLAAAYDHVLNANGELLAMADDQPNPRRRTLVGLPEHTRHFVGRTPELSRIATALGDQRDIRTCVISGMAGVGKTALAVAAAWQAAAGFRDGCLFFDLRGHGDDAQTTAEAAHHLLGALDVTHDLIPADPDGRANLLRDVLRNRQVLLVLDNVRDARQVRPLLPAAGPSRVIVTSRARLPGLDDAWHVPLETLETTAGLSLFHAVLDGRADVHDADAAAVVNQCGGLPLAIRIAAGRVLHGGLDVQHLLQRLTDASTMLQALEEGDRGVATALTVIFDALPHDQRNLMGALSAHPGTTMTVYAAQALAGLDLATTEHLLDRLHEQHLLTRTPGRHVRLHDLVHAFASLNARPDEGTTASMFARLADHYLATTTEADTLIEPLRFRPQHSSARHSEPPFGDATGALAWLRANWPAIVRMTELVDDDRRWQLALAARGFFFREKLFDAWISTHERALGTVDDPSTQGKLLNSLGMAQLESGHPEASVQYHQRAHANFVEAGDEPGATDALASRAWARLYQGYGVEALRDLTNALQTYRHTHRERNVVITLRGIAFAHSILGHHDGARASAANARELSSTPIDVVRALNCMALVEYQAGTLDTARDLSSEAAELAEQTGNGYEHARALTSLGNIAAHQGNDGEAAHFWSMAAERAELNPRVVWEKAAHQHYSHPESGTPLLHPTPYDS